MSRRLLRLAVIGLIFGFAAVTSARASDPEDAKAMAEKAVALFKVEGEKAFAKFSDPNGEFVKGDIYITVLDKQGVVRANIKPNIIGVNMWEATDPDGVKFSQLSWKSTENSETAWISFKNVNPVTKKIEPKRTWVHRVGDYIIQSGVYVTP